MFYSSIETRGDFLAAAIEIVEREKNKQVAKDLTKMNLHRMLVEDYLMMYKIKKIATDANTNLANEEEMKAGEVLENQYYRAQSQLD